MQSVLNSVKGTALGVAEYLTPVLKVSVVEHIAHVQSYRHKMNNIHEILPGIEIS